MNKLTKNGYVSRTSEKKPHLWADSERNQQYDSVTTELYKLMQQYDRKKNPFDIDIADIVNELNEKKISVMKRDDDYNKFINNTLFSRSFIDSIDLEIEGLSLIEFTNKDNKQSANEYMKILKDKHYLLSKTLICFMKQEIAISEMDNDLGETISEYINKYLHSKYTSRVELFNWISVQNERIELLNITRTDDKKDKKEKQNE
jgi:hypothetical protein